MGIMEEKDPRFVGIEKKVGIFIAVAVLSIVVAIVFIGLEREVFTAKAKIYFIADSGENLISGQSVKFKGFRIGKIEDVSLNDSGKVEVRLSVLLEYLPFIKADSIATLSQEGVIGDYIISISQGSEGMPNVYDGGGVYFERATSLEDIANELKGQVEEAIIEIKRITAYVTDPEGDIKQTIRNVREITENAKQTQKNVDDLLITLNSDLSSALKNTTSTLETVQDDVVPQALSLMSTSEDTISGLYNDVQGLMDKADKSMENVLALTKEMKATAERVPFAMEQGINLMEDTSEVLGAVKKIWPLNKHISEEQGGAIPVDSYE